MPLRLTITVGGQEIDYSKYVDWKGLRVQEDLNLPSKITFSLIPSDSAFKSPPQRAYVKLTSDRWMRSLFTGYIASEPKRSYIAPAPSVFGEQGFVGIPAQLFQYSVIATSDEHLLNIKAVPFIPAFVNRSQGQILSDLADILCPNFFDTSMVGSGDIIPFYQYETGQSWSEIGKKFADASRYRLKVRDKQIFYTPYGDQPLGIRYDERLGQGTFAPKDLNTDVLSVPVVNDVTIIGDVEAGNSREDYFIGDGFTGNFALQHKVFRGASTVLLKDDWNSGSLNKQNWYTFPDPNPVFDLTLNFLNVVNNPPTNGGIAVPLGTSYLAMQNGLELAGGICLEHGDFQFNEYSEGIIGGVYLDDLFAGPGAIEQIGNVIAPSGVLCGFYVSSATGNIVFPQSVVDQQTGQLFVGTGVGGVVIQPMWEGQPVGNPIVTQPNHSYVLSTIITAPRYTRYTRLYRTVEGEEFGGAENTVFGNVTFQIAK